MTSVCRRRRRRDGVTRRRRFSLEGEPRFKGGGLRGVGGQGFENVVTARVRGPHPGRIGVQKTGQRVTRADGAGGRAAGDVSRRAGARGRVRTSGYQGQGRGSGRGRDAAHGVIDGLGDELGVEGVRQDVGER
jgi:hypothetical protein